MFMPYALVGYFDKETDHKIKIYGCALPMLALMIIYLIQKIILI